MDNRARAAMIRKVERKIRAKYRKRCLIFFVVALIVGILLGILACTQGIIPVKGKAEPTLAQNQPTATAPLGANDPLKANNAPDSTPTPTPVPTAEATVVVPTPTPTVVPTEDAGGGTISDAVVSAMFPENPLGEIDPSQSEPTAQVLVAPTATLLVPTAIPTVNPVSPEGTEPVAPEATPEVAVMDPNATGSKTNPVRAGEAFEFETQVLPDGMKRASASSTQYDTLRFSITLENFLMPDYFAANYANRYKLTGYEAGAEIKMSLLSSTGANSVLPQNAVLITFENEAGEINEGYQLMDAAISGTYDIPLAPGETKTLYKRFKYSEQEAVKYMVVTYYMDGMAYKTYFLLEVVQPAVTYDTLVKGDRGDNVKAMQERLVELGYLSDTADGIFGGNTETAIRAAQEAGGLPKSGVADSEFQQFIFSDSAPAAQ